MKAMVRIIMVAAIGILFLASTAFAALLEGNPPFSGFLGDPSVYQQLKPGPKDGAKLRWIKEGTDFAKYKKFMVDSVVFYISEQSDFKGVDPELTKELSDAFNAEMVAAFKGKYEIVSEPGPDVARIRVAITNIKQSRPVISAVTSVVPVGLAVNIVKKGVTGGWTGSGETCGEIQILDSTTNEVIGTAVDQQKAAFTERFTRYGSAKDAFKFWSERLVKFIDDAKRYQY
jgi:hypothetical protein